MKKLRQKQLWETIEVYHPTCLKHIGGVIEFVTSIQVHYLQFSFDWNSLHPGLCDAKTIENSKKKLG